MQPQLMSINEKEKVNENEKEGLNKTARDLPDFTKGLNPQNVKDFKEADKPIEIKTINSDLVGKEHPETGVKFVEKTVELSDGTKIKGIFPEFPHKFEYKMNECEYKLSDREQVNICNKAIKEKIENDPEFAKQFTKEQIEEIKEGYTPDGYIWHHSEEPGLMQLVDSEVHARTGHTGGRYLWGGGSENR